MTRKRVEVKQKEKKANWNVFAALKVFVKYLYSKAVAGMKRTPKSARVARRGREIESVCRIY
jgi:hypothetical protein